MIEEEFQNPIDKDKTSESPGTLPYAHHVGSAVIKPADKGKIKGRALAAMYEQTDLQLNQIKEQIDLLVRQARELEDRVRISEKIYNSQLKFSPVIGHVYFLYQDDAGNFKLLMIHPDEWDSDAKNLRYIASVKLLGDHTWQIIDGKDDRI
ncbi:MAG: hypothetical protein Kow0075_12650 [Salibacteraceae bacterium]